ncbi:CPBP family intramembrane glutamic endopeptidase [Amycolatopsis nigrescens]|uniref:CPBP family intramembrane glutamic endopeptidase n=1 Tax=Amycolatopsis nigrescens TaxID=381445 RepID=UPI00038032CD|nr:CPBP family intramembrane glutamic endopeptidase [Amycolatopsis nigrescens]
MDREQGDEPSAPPSAGAGLVLGAHWGFLAFFLGFGGYQLAALIMTAALSGRVNEFDPLELPEVGPLLLLAFVPNLLLGLAPALAARLWGPGFKATFRLLPTLRDLKVGLACGGFALLAGYLLNLLLLGVYGTDQLDDNPLTGLSEGLGDGTVWLVLAAVIVVAAAPLTEELLVRGALWNALAHYRVPGWVILILTSVIFAQLHGEPARTVALLAQGAAIGFARLTTGGVAAPLVAHAANNLPAALTLFAGG